jgi:hypothetical protein
MSKDAIELAISVLNAEKANLSHKQRERLAELSEAGEDVRERVTNTLKSKEKFELPPEQADKLIRTLRTRFELPENKKLREAVGDFASVDKSLRAQPEKLYTLNKLEETGGEPQLISIDGDEFVFEDRSAESPSGRRNLDFDQSLAQAREFGVDMQSPESYESMKKTGQFDKETWSWLKTDLSNRRSWASGQYAVIGHTHKSRAVVYRRNAIHKRADVGWRATLRVKIVK